MMPKRIIAVVTIKNGIVVQSFGYKKYLPLGKPEIIIKNLNRWRADEILVNVIDRSAGELGPDLKLLKKIQKLRINTPIIYSGGIKSLEDAKSVINYGADRIMLESIIYANNSSLEKISNLLGSQAIILSVPVSIEKNNLLFHYNYLDKKKIELKENSFSSINKKLVSEVMIIDYLNEGYDDKFDIKILDNIKFKLPIICFGGIKSEKKIKQILKKKNVVAIGIGNSLNYRENAIQKIKTKLTNFNIREAFFKKEIYEY